MQGNYIASSPHPVSQKVFMSTLRKYVGMPIGLPAFESMVRIGAPLFFGTDPELVLYGCYIVLKCLAEESFEFRFPELNQALADLLKQPPGVS
jgi:NAD dependent epimerase/dehydratase family enzyme